MKQSLIFVNTEFLGAIDLANGKGFLRFQDPQRFGAAFASIEE